MEMLTEGERKEILRDNVDFIIKIFLLSGTGQC